jgi:peroxiredoxin
MPQFEKAFQKHAGAGFTILAISVDQKREELETYLTKKPVTFPILVDPDSKLAKQLKVRAYPTSVLIENGKVLRVTEGMLSHLEFEIERLLRRAKP